MLFNVNTETNKDHKYETPQKLIKKVKYILLLCLLCSAVIEIVYICLRGFSNVFLAGLIVGNVVVALNYKLTNMMAEFMLQKLIASAGLMFLGKIIIYAAGILLCYKRGGDRMLTAYAIGVLKIVPLLLILLVMDENRKRNSRKK